ncbi:hypothetical protein M8J77_014987 [Diaphorina citri]|nr:hypothetical protein M8J77_014987 [Diaphorina citri]
MSSFSVEPITLPSRPQCVPSMVDSYLSRYNHNCHSPRLSGNQIGDFHSINLMEFQLSSSEYCQAQHK